MSRSRSPGSRSRSGLRGRGQRSPRVEVEASGLEVEVEVTGVEVEIKEGRCRGPNRQIHSSVPGAGPAAPGATVRGQRPPGRECVVRCNDGSQRFVHAQPFPSLAAVLPQGIPPRMRCATWNVDLPQSYFVAGRRQHHPAIVGILQQVDLLALQEVGGWDSPLDKEPSRRSTVGRGGP